MERVNKVWVFTYRYNHLEFIGYHEGSITVSTFKTENVNTAADRAKVQVQSLLKRRGIDLIDGYELDLDLDLSYLL